MAAVHSSRECASGKSSPSNALAAATPGKKRKPAAGKSRKKRKKVRYSCIIRDLMRDERTTEEIRENHKKRLSKAMPKVVCSKLSPI